MTAKLRKMLCRLVGHRFVERTHYIQATGALKIKRCLRCGHVDMAEMRQARQFPFPKATR